MQDIVNVVQALKKSDVLADLSRLISLSEQYAKFRMVTRFWGAESQILPIGNAELIKRFEEKAGNLKSINELEKYAALVFKDEP